MPTLTLVASKTKLILKWFSISILYFSLIFVATKIGVAIKERLAPTPPPAPTVAFGKLPPIAFPISATDKKLTYSLDTITGLLPSLPYQARVYKMAQIKPRFLALDNARQKVYRVGFVSSETHLSQNWYRWIDETFPSREITINLFSHDFTLSSSFLSDPLAPRLTGNFSNVNSAINASQRFLFAMSYFPDDIDLTRTKTLIYSIRDGVLTPETNVSKAQVIRVDFFQGNVDKLPIYYPNPSTSTINLLVTSLQDQELVVGANFHYQPISKKADIYPIKTATQAFNELKAQKAYIASYFGKTSNISIKNIFLGYYIGEGKQNYLLPVVIFEGINGFFAYVSAIMDEWIGS
jgi:hypothetical protein